MIANKGQQSAKRPPVSDVLLFALFLATFGLFVWMLLAFAFGTSVQRAQRISVPRSASVSAYAGLPTPKLCNTAMFTWKSKCRL